MAQCAAGREDRRHLARVRGRDRADAIDAAVHGRQPAVRDSVRDASSANAGRSELSGRDNPALTGGKRRDRRVTRVHFVALIAADRERATFCTSAVRFVALIERRGIRATKCTRIVGRGVGGVGRGHEAEDAAA
jgi:hypothetical protein